MMLTNNLLMGVLNLALVFIMSLVGAIVPNGVTGFIGIALLGNGLYRLRLGSSNNEDFEGAWKFFKIYLLFTAVLIVGLIMLEQFGSNQGSVVSLLSYASLIGVVLYHYVLLRVVDGLSKLKAFSHHNLNFDMVRYLIIGLGVLGVVGSINVSLYPTSNILSVAINVYLTLVFAGIYKHLSSKQQFLD